MNFSRPSFPLIGRRGFLGCGAAILLGLVTAPQELEAGVPTLPNTASTDTCDLILNGTALRRVLGFKIYVAGLYLSEPCDSCETIMRSDRKGKRVHITMMREISAERFEKTTQDNVMENFSSAERARYSGELDAFFSCFRNGASLREGSEVTIDYLPEQGTQITVDGKRYDLIPGHDFYHCLLRLWIGKPPQGSLKTGMLGMAG